MQYLLTKLGKLNSCCFHGLTDYMISPANSQIPENLALGVTLPLQHTLLNTKPESSSPSPKDSSSSVLKPSPLVKLKKEGNRWQPDSYCFYRELSQFIWGVNFSSVSAMNEVVWIHFWFKSIIICSNPKFFTWEKYLVGGGELMFVPVWENYVTRNQVAPVLLGLLC